jgi:hypothetical protein
LWGAGVTDFDHKVELFEAAFAAYKRLAPSHRQTTAAPCVDQSFFPPKTSRADNGELSGGVEKRESAPVNLDAVATECPFINEALATGGKAFANPLWNITNLIATFTEGGRADAHRMGDKHPTYTEESTDEQFDRKLRERAEKGLGWPSCNAITNAGYIACQACPHFGKGKSPLSFAPKPQIASQVTASAAAVDNLPKGYLLHSDGIVCRVVTNDDDTTVTVPLCNYPMTSPWLQKEPWVLHFTTVTDTHGPTQLAMPTEVCASNETFRKWCHSKALMIDDAQAKLTRRFIMSWIQTLQQIKQSVISSKSFGWSVRDGNVEGFVFDGQVWTPSGNHPAANPDPVIANQYAPTGKIDHWCAAAKLITNQKRPALDAILAASFGAPLVRFTGQSGLLMSVYSLESGVGKSTALKVGQAVWGDPIRATQSLSDTQNSVLNKIGEIRNLPLYWDELKTEEDTRKFVNLAFQLSLGKEKSRLTQSVLQRNPGTWQTILISASNDSLLDYIVGRTKTTTAGLYRVFEYEVETGSVGQIAPSTAQRLVARLNDNYGQVGLEYARFLGANCAHIDQEVGEFLEELEKEVGPQADERYWTALITAVCVGARYANELGFTAIDETALKEFMVNSLSNMRAERVKQPIDMTQTFNVSNMLAKFTNDMRARHTIFTNRIHLGPGKPANGAIKILNIDESKLEALYVQIGREDKIMRISSTAFYDWLRQNELPQKVLREALERQLAMKTIKARMAAGTRYAGAQEYLLEIDLAATQAINFIDEA